MSASQFVRSLVAVFAAAATLCVVAGCTTGGQDSTRAQVRKDLATFRCAGFDPVADEITYPADVERTQAGVASGKGCATNQHPPTRP
ncbi:DUF4148 domain-containing protein [Caballeronia sp. ATUFL_M1_KS5A]|uniref:DUF4148 domain-containing protein n=1 Tax=Caballeronia sp. ATUFL_M1_KS5A TaxID=2921778 RepID=UPI0032EE9F7D